MKRKTISLALAALLLTACSAKQDIVVATPESAALVELSSESASSVAATPEPTATTEPTPELTAAPTSAPEPTAVPTPEPTAVPTQAPAPEPTAAPAAEQVPAQVSMSYGAVPYNLAAGTDQWWSIDSSDSAYWAVAENINAMRAAAGLPALTVDGGLSSIANSRCDNFASGAAFDHAGAVTGEIIASGPFDSASSVCSAWQSSPGHYASIVSPSYTSMGIGCWFCSTAEGNYSYWAVTFQ